jgi:uncharacterized membrane protein
VTRRTTTEPDPNSPTSHLQQKETTMNAVNTFFIHLAVSGSSIYGRINNRRARANATAAERGSLTLEQIIWTVAIAAVAIAVVAIVVGIINAKAAQLTAG